MQAVDRSAFVPAEIRSHSWEDSPQPIGCDQTISAPHMVAIMSEALRLRPGMQVLEVGTGRGYHAAVTAELVGPTGHVTSIETVPDLADLARDTLVALGYGKRITVLQGDGSLGHPEGAPYDRIYGTCAARDISGTLRDQAARDAILLFPLGRQWSQQLVREERIGGGDWVRGGLGAVIFVPLIGEMGFTG